MNCLAYRTIYNARRGCMMAVSETANSSGKASGESRPSRPSKSKTTTCRKARFNWATGSTGWQANHNVGCGLACLWGSFNSALSRNLSEGYAPSQFLGAGVGLPGGGNELIISSINSAGGPGVRQIVIRIK